MELRQHRKNYLILLAIVSAIPTFMVAYRAYAGRPFTALDWESTRNIATFLIMVTPFIFYNFLYHPTKGFTYAMLPASITEKFASAWAHCVIVLPILLYATVFATTFLTSLLLGVEAFYQNPINRPFFVYFSAVTVQSLAFCGVFWFKRKKISKTILTMILFGLGIGLIGTIAVKAMGQEMTEEIGERIMAFFANREGSLRAFGRVLNTAFLITLWTLAFFKLRRTQI